MIRAKRLWELTKQSVTSWLDDGASSMGAAVAFYTVFSLAPLLIIVIAIAGAVFGQEAARGEIMAQLDGLIGSNGAKAIEAMVEGAQNKKVGLFATLLGMGTLIIAATTVFAELKTSLDQIWEVPTESGKGIWALIRTRLLSFSLILALGFLLLVSLIFSAALNALAKYWGTLISETVLLEVVNFLVSFASITVLIAIIYKFLPNTKIAWRDVWIGALITALLFSIGKLLIGIYLGHSSISSSFGAAGSLVVLLLWVYYSSQIFFLGAEFTKVYAHSHGSCSVKHNNDLRG